LLPLNLVTPDAQGRSFALHPSMPELQALFNTDKKLAIINGASYVPHLETYVGPDATQLKSSKPVIAVVMTSQNSS